MLPNFCVLGMTLEPDSSGKFGKFKILFFSLAFGVQDGPMMDTAPHNSRTKPANFLTFCLKVGEQWRLKKTGEPSIPGKFKTVITFLFIKKPL